MKLNWSFSINTALNPTSNEETSFGFKRRVVGALKAGSESVLEEFLDNPYLNVGKAVIKGWMKPE